MRGRSAPCAKIRGCLDESATKMVLPDSIDNYASGQWISRGGDPVSQFETTAFLGPRWRRHKVSEELGNVARNFFAEFLWVAAKLDVCVGSFPFADGIGDWQRRGSTAPLHCQQLIANIAQLLSCRVIGRRSLL